MLASLLLIACRDAPHHHGGAISVPAKHPAAGQPALPEADGALNGCDPAAALDRRGEAVVEVRFGGALGHAYDARCLRVSAGAQVRFLGSFATHPIAPGRIIAGLPQLERESPIGVVEEGDEASFVLPKAGPVGFFCNYHVDEGMLGAIFVDAPAAEFAQLDAMDASP